MRWLTVRIFRCAVDYRDQLQLRIEALANTLDSVYQSKDDHESEGEVEIVDFS
jgi:hypothetical protein